MDAPATEASNGERSNRPARGGEHRHNRQSTGRQRGRIRGGYIAGLRTDLVNRRKPLNEALADYRFKTLADATPRLEALARPTATSRPRQAAAKLGDRETSQPWRAL